MDSRKIEELVCRLDAARKGGNTWRFHNWTLIRPESVAQHTFNMLQTAMVLLDGQLSRGLMLAIMNHDLGEAATGDIPAPVKKMLSVGTLDALRQMEDAYVGYIHQAFGVSLTDYEQSVLKFCDTLDCLMKCREEAMLGNRTLGQVARACRRYVEDMNVAEHWKHLAYEIYDDYVRITE